MKTPMRLAEAPQPEMKRVNASIPTPTPGWCVLRIVKPDKSSGGILIPENSQGNRARCYMVASAGHYYQEGSGARVDVEIPVGALCNLYFSDLIDYESLTEGHGLCKLQAITSWVVPTLPEQN